MPVRQQDGALRPGPACRWPASGAPPESAPHAVATRCGSALRQVERTVSRSIATSALTTRDDSLTPLVVGDAHNDRSGDARHREQRSLNRIGGHVDTAAHDHVVGSTLHVQHAVVDVVPGRWS